MKSYTDIEQSKKLAEILPLESADMAWCNNSIRGVNYTDEYSANLYTVKEMQECFDKTLNGWDKYWKLIPCWSLAALINVIPQELFDGEYIINITEGIDNKWVITYDHHENRNHSYYGLSTGADNLVDACVEMILKLHEQNFL